ncbi:MAG: alkaline phosphatase family protein [Thermoleophilia bacterium]
MKRKEIVTVNQGSRRRQIVVIGLDGTPFSFLRKQTDAGNLPNIAALVSGGIFSRMETEIPTVSSVAWASFMTGKNPAEHGIYGFTDRKPDSYELYFPNYAHLKSEPFWDHLGNSGRRCCILNVPSTYPARPVNGVLVSGFVAPNLERATYPAEALEYLQKIGYRIDVDAAKGRESLDLLVEDLHLTMEKRREAMLHFWRSEKWDLFVNVFTSTDRLHHFMWQHYEDGDSKYGEEFMRYYRRLDEIIGEFVAEMPDDVNLFMLSDHGFSTIRYEVFLNNYLKEWGFLALKETRAVTIADIDSAASKAYCMDPGRLYLNLAGREPGGIVSKSDYHNVIDELKEAILSIEDIESGEQVIKAVYSREELFHGPLLERAPDLVALPFEGYDLKGAIGRPEGMVLGHMTGMHTHDDAFWYASGDSEINDVQHIRDAARAITGSLG